MGKIDWSDIFHIKTIHVDSLYGRVERHGFVHHDHGGYYVDEVIVDHDPFPRGTLLDGICIIHDNHSGLDVRVFFIRDEKDGLSVIDWEVI